MPSDRSLDFSSGLDPMTWTVSRRKPSLRKTRTEANAVGPNGAVNWAMKTGACRHDRLIAFAGRPQNSRRCIVRPTASPLLDVVHAADDDDCRSALHYDHTSSRRHGRPRYCCCCCCRRCRNRIYFHFERRFLPRREAWLMRDVRSTQPDLSYLKADKSWPISDSDHCLHCNWHGATTRSASTRTMSPTTPDS